jgi:hypothetical protein
VRSDVFVAKLNASGSSLGYLTYLGGNNVDVNSDLAVTPTGTVYVTGTTYSDDFPPGTSGPALARRNAFVTQLNSSGGRVSSMLLGGSSVDDGVGVAVSGTNLWVGATSLSSSFQGASAPLGNWDALLTKMTLP